ncbi:hypothetical protein GCM10009642_26200 [Nocardiopsis metallicus]
MNREVSFVTMVGFDIGRGLLMLSALGRRRASSKPGKAELRANRLITDAMVNQDRGGSNSMSRREVNDFATSKPNRIRSVTVASPARGLSDRYAQIGALSHTRTHSPRWHLGCVV